VKGVVESRGLSGLFDVRAATYRSSASTCRGSSLRPLQAKIFAELRNRLEIERNTIRSWSLVRDQHSVSRCIIIMPIYTA
jgi:hypothetical protein